MDCLLPSRAASARNHCTCGPENCLACWGAACNVSAHQAMRLSRQQCNLGYESLDDGATERVEILSDQDERPGTADDIILVVYLEPAVRVGMLGGPRLRLVHQDHQTIDDDAFGDDFVAGKHDVAARSIGAVAGHLDGAALAGDRRA